MIVPGCRSESFLVPAGALVAGRTRICTVAVLLLGAASVTLAQDVDPADQSGAFLAQARAAADLASQNFDSNRQAERISRVRYDSGLASLSEWIESMLALIEARADLKVAELDVEEIEIGGGPVRTEMSAPLIEGRDFVSERLQIELDTVAAREMSLAEIIKVTEAEVGAGVATDADLRPLIMERARLAADAERVRQTMALRQSFLSGDTDVAEAEQRLRMLRAKARQQTADATLAALRAAIAPLQDRLAEAELQAAQFEVASIEREISR